MVLENQLVADRATAPHLGESYLARRPHDTEIHFSTASLRQVIEAVPQKDREIIEQFVSQDPALKAIRAEVMGSHPELKDLSQQLALRVAEKVGELVSTEARPALTTLVDFYFGYLRPFPDPTEVESLKAILGHFRELPNWDVILAKNSEGLVIGACSGHILDVACPSGNFKLGWNEHTWVNKEDRRLGIGEKLATIFETRAEAAGALGVVIEVDNPYSISRDPRAFVQDRLERQRFWTDSKDGLGQAMDPFQRLQFWGKQGYCFVCTEKYADERATPDLMAVPYTLVSLDVGAVGPCETIALAFKPNGNYSQASLQRDQYVAIFDTFQSAVDGDAKYYPEFVRTKEDIKTQIGSDSLFLVPLNSDRVADALESDFPLVKPLIMQRDVDYCIGRLLKTDIDAKERSVLMKSLDYLLKTMPIAEAASTEQGYLSPVAPSKVGKAQVVGAVTELAL